MDAEEFRTLVAIGREQQGVEFKGPGSRTGNRQLMAKVFRAVLSMANRQDGGLVIVGVAERPTGLDPVGLTDEELATWAYDDLAESLAEFSDPSIEFDTEIVESDGHKFLVIRVREFREIPVLCKRDYPDVLRKGACYVRSRRKPETVEIPTQEDMRDLIELATKKGVRRFVTQAHEAGLVISGQAPPTDSEQFERQVSDLLGLNR
jgi:predicted HTH transcriptional regulator